MNRSGHAHLFRDIPIKRKLNLITMLTSGVALLLACMGFVAYEQMTFRRTMALDLAVLTDMFEDNVAPGLTFNDAKSIEQTLKSLDAHPHILAAAVYDDAGHVVATFQRSNSPEGYPFPAAQKMGTRFEGGQLNSFREIMLAGERIGTVYIASDLEELNARFWRYGIIVGVVLLVSSLVAFTLSARLQTVISEPISHLSRVAGAVATNRNYSVRAIKQGEDELGGLIDAFNEMLGQIQSRDSALREARDKLEERVQERTSELEQEIAERKQVEEALRTSELKFRQFAENIREVFWMTTPDMREIIYVSPAYQEVWGRSAESLYQNPAQWIEAILPEDRPRIVEACHQLASSQPAYDIEYRIQRPDGSIRWIRDRGVQVLDDHGRVYRTAGVASDITERKRTEADLEQAHKELMDASRQAGMAEVATGVLHNVGNVLNSVNVSATLVSDKMERSKLGNLGKAVALLQSHSADLGTFITSDPKGKQLPGYLVQVTEHLTKEQQNVIAELESLRKNIEHIKDIVAMQQSYAKVSGVAESVKVIELVEDALQMNSGALTRHEVQVVREFGDHLPEIIVDRHKVLQILVNLIRNAKYACDDSGRNDKRILLRAVNGEGRIRISVADNGVGIPKENLTRIFSHGFTTRKDGHGFGLHSGALAAKELGGSLNVFSEGPGRGACFTLDLPVQHTRANS